MKTALFPGTFNPFTIGHADIAERALKLFDRLVIAIGYNEHKADADSAAAMAGQRVNEIRRIFADRPEVEVTAYSGLTASLVRETGACCIVRGVRSCTDFDYEKNIADVNLEVLGVDTIFIPCRPELAHISSSMIRELSHNGHDISRFLP